MHCQNKTCTFCWINGPSNLITKDTELKQIDIPDYPEFPPINSKPYLAKSLGAFKAKKQNDPKIMEIDHQISILFGTIESLRQYQKLLLKMKNKEKRKIKKIPKKDLFTL